MSKRLEEALKESADREVFIDNAWKHAKKYNFTRVRSNKVRHLRLDEANARDLLIAKLFQAARLDPKEVIHWKRIVSMLAQMHYKKSGAPKKRGSSFYYWLRVFTLEVSRSGAKSAMEIVKTLRSKKPYSHFYARYEPNSLRKEVGRVLDNKFDSVPSADTILRVSAGISLPTNELTVEEQAVMLAYMRDRISDNSEAYQKAVEAYKKRLGKKRPGFKAPIR